MKKLLNGTIALLVILAVAMLSGCAGQRMDEPMNDSMNTMSEDDMGTSMEPMQEDEMRQEGMKKPMNDTMK